MLDKTKALAAIAETFRIASIPKYRIIPPEDLIFFELASDFTLKCAVLRGLPDNDFPLTLGNPPTPCPPVY